jgi:predicted short-subunit dehydrogenase-like oxidoreductase (DUF2520 family)
MVRRICVVGAGRVGSALAARLEERGVAVRRTGRELDTGDAELVLLCVPDRAIAEVAGRLEPGPWVAHTSGATSLAALDPHVSRFSLHPLQTFVRRRGAEQLDGAWAAISAESDRCRAQAVELAEALGLRPFDLREDSRVLYHAGATLVSGFLVTLHRAAVLLFGDAATPTEALLPLMRRTIDNGFEATGPISRGDWVTVEAHLAELDRHRPELVPLYRELAQVTACESSGEAA